MRLLSRFENRWKTAIELGWRRRRVVSAKLNVKESKRKRIAKTVSTRRGLNNSKIGRRHGLMPNDCGLFCLHGKNTPKRTKELSSRAAKRMDSGAGSPW